MVQFLRCRLSLSLSGQGFFGLNAHVRGQEDASKFPCCDTELIGDTKEAVGAVCLSPQRASAIARGCWMMMIMMIMLGRRQRGWHSEGLCQTQHTHDDPNQSSGCFEIVISFKPGLTAICTAVSSDTERIKLTECTEKMNHQRIDYRNTSIDCLFQVDCTTRDFCKVKR